MRQPVPEVASRARAAAGSQGPQSAAARRKRRRKLRRPAPPAAAHAAVERVKQEVNSNLDSLKDTLLRLELRRQAGTITDEEYALERGRAEQLLRDLVQG